MDGWSVDTTDSPSKGGEDECANGATTRAWPDTTDDPTDLLALG